jgi:hypothetical protein
MTKSGLLRRFASRNDENMQRPSPLHIKLFAEVVADLHDHRDAFGIARPGFGRLVGLGAEFPGVLVAENGNPDSVRTVA